MSLGAYSIVGCAILAIGYLSALAHILQVCWSCVRARRQCSPLNLVARARAWISCGGGSAQEDEKIRMVMERNRIMCMQNFTHVFMHFSALVLLVSLASDVLLFLTGWRPLPWMKERDLPLRLGRIFEATMVLVLCKLVVAFPRSVTSPVMNSSYVLFCVLRVTKDAALMDADSLILDRPVSLTLTVILGLIVCNQRTTVPCSVLLWLSESFILYLQSKSAAETSILYGRSTSITVQIGVLAVTHILILICFEQAVWAASRYVLEVKAASKTEVTVQRLLSALCDAVVTLGPDLRISKRAPKLANLLLQGNPVRALEGSPFLDLLVETDQVRFHNFLAHAPDEADSSCSEPTPAQALNVSLHDSTGTGVQVQLFHSHFEDDSGQVGHLIGICEMVDRAGGRAGGQEDPPPRPASAPREGNARPSNATSGDNSVRSNRTDSDSDTSLRLDSASVASAQSRSNPALAGQRVAGSVHHGRAQGAETVVAPLQEQVAAAEEEVPWRRLEQEECGITFNALRFKFCSQQSVQPLIDADLSEVESLQHCVSEWRSCRAWIQDLLNMALRPVKASSWPASEGPPAFVHFHVDFGGTCPLPPDMLSRSDAPAGGGADCGTKSGDTSAPVGGDEPLAPVSVAISRVKILRGRPQSPSRTRSRWPHQLPPGFSGSSGRPSGGSSGRPSGGSGGRPSGGSGSRPSGGGGNRVDVRPIFFMEAAALSPGSGRSIASGRSSPGRLGRTSRDASASGGDQSDGVLPARLARL